jgi:hypothetical protein
MRRTPVGRARVTWVMWIVGSASDLQEQCPVTGPWRWFGQLHPHPVGNPHNLWIKLWNAEPPRSSSTAERAEM